MFFHWFCLFGGFFFLLRQSISSLFASFILMDSTCECEETTPKQKCHPCQVPCVSLSLLYPTQGQCSKVQHWGNADPGSPVASLRHTSPLCPSVSSGRKPESWLIPQPHSLTLLSAGHQNKAIEMTFIPGKPSPGIQKQKGTYEGVLILDDACTQLKE